MMDKKLIKAKVTGERKMEFSSELLEEKGMTNKPKELAREILEIISGYETNRSAISRVESRAKQLAKMVIEKGKYRIDGDVVFHTETISINDLNELIKQTKQEQREKDAKIAELYEDNLRCCENQDFYDELADRIAKAIRGS